ncbi:hypothetical protein AAG570_009373 [Ranatra chinensis]|uniref:Uncharacterized protein n=1 Tax=Ranatra chinensis TaxID=642074 RepID=A0ABD0Z1W5_9HEMI
MFHKKKTQETTENARCNLPPFCDCKSKYCPPLYALPRKKDFCLVADSPESLDKLADSMRKKKSIVNALERIKNRYHDEVTMKGLSSLYKQWHEFRERSQASIDLSLEYWLTRNSSVISESNGGECNRSLNETQVEVTGKRIQRRKVTNNISEVCSSDSGSDESVGSNSSDWEDRNIKRKEKDITISRVHPPDENSENTLPQPSISIISASPSMKPHNSRSIDNSSMMSGNIEVQPYLDTDKPVSSNITYSNLVNNNISSGDDGFSPSSLNRFLPIEIDEKHQKFGYFLPTDNDKFEESETKNLQLSPVHFDAQFFPESVCQELFSHPTASNCSRIQGNLVVRAMSDGSFGYAVRLPDGGIINVTNEEILRIKAKNGGIIPKIVTIPIVDLSTVSPLYDDLQTKSLHEQ